MNITEILETSINYANRQLVRKPFTIKASDVMAQGSNVIHLIQKLNDLKFGCVETWLENTKDIYIKLQKYDYLNADYFLNKFSKKPTEDLYMFAPYLRCMFCNEKGENLDPKIGFNISIILSYQIAQDESCYLASSTIGDIYDTLDIDASTTKLQDLKRSWQENNVTAVADMFKGLQELEKNNELYMHRNLDEERGFKKVSINYWFNRPQLDSKLKEHMRTAYLKVRKAEPNDTMLRTLNQYGDALCLI